MQLRNRILFIFNLYVNSHMNESQPFYPDLWGLDELNPSYFSDFICSNHCYPDFLAVPEQPSMCSPLLFSLPGMLFPLVFLHFLSLLKCYLARESFPDHSKILASFPHLVSNLLYFLWVMITTWCIYLFMNCKFSESRSLMRWYCCVTQSLEQLPAYSRHSVNI